MVSLIHHIPPQWLPLPLFLLYRLIVFAYMAAWLIAHGAIRGETSGLYWFIYITDWAFLLQVIAMAGVTLVTLIYYTCTLNNKNEKEDSRMSRCLPVQEVSSDMLYRQDNLHWVIRIVWVTYIVAATSTVLAGLGYWTIVYDSNCSSDNQTMDNTSISHAMEINSTSSSADNCGPDAASLHAHGVNILILFIDLILSLIPFHLLHFLYPCILTTAYVVFSGVFYAAGGTDRHGHRYIYKALDYENSPLTSSIAAVCLCIVPAVVYLIPFTLALLRDIVYQRLNSFHIYTSTIQVIQKSIPNLSIHTPRSVSMPIMSASTHTPQLTNLRAIKSDHGVAVSRLLKSTVV